LISAILGLVFAARFRFSPDADVIGAEGRETLYDFIAILYVEARAAVTRLVARISQRQPEILPPALRTPAFQHVSYYTNPSRIAVNRFQAVFVKY
jgi:hypothetical protein